MKYIAFSLLFLFAQANYAQNIMISDEYHPNEPSIIINPKNPAQILAASNINNYYFSQDTGKTWTTNKLTSPELGVWGDPALLVDTLGDFYFFHLSNPANGNWIDRIVCQKTSDLTTTWTSGSYMGLNGTKVQDKEWPVVNPANNHIYITWTEFDQYDSDDPADSSRIMFSKSLDAGATWAPAKKINKVNGDCVDSDNTVEGATPAIGPNGELYVAWAGPEGLIFDRSLDEGDTWLNDDIFVSDFPGGWDYSVPGIYRCNGLPVTKCDISGGTNHGTIYINWTDQRNGENDTDVWLAKSTDNGNTWSAPIRVNNDPADRHQFLTWMDIDQTTGYLYFVFYDRRNYSDSQTDVYLALSKDGGETFINRKISESPFTPTPGIFFGDYNNISVHDGIVRPIWTRLQGGQLSIWTNITPSENIFTATQEASINISSIETFPNPVSTKDKAYISFKLHKPSTITISIYNASGQLVYQPLTQKMFGSGKHIVPVELKKLGKTSGAFHYTLDVNGQKISKKLMVE